MYIVAVNDGAVMNAWKKDQVRTVWLGLGLGLEGPDWLGLEVWSFWLGPSG